MLDDQRGYYLIGYAPDAATFKGSEAKPSFHRIKLSVKRPGLQVRSRAGFYGRIVEGGTVAPPRRSAAARAVVASPFDSGDMRLQLTSLFAHEPKARLPAPLTLSRRHARHSTCARWRASWGRSSSCWRSPSATTARSSTSSAGRRTSGWRPSARGGAPRGPHVPTRRPGEEAGRLPAASRGARREHGQRSDPPTSSSRSPTSSRRSSRSPASSSAACRPTGAPSPERRHGRDSRAAPLPSPARRSPTASPSTTRASIARRACRGSRRRCGCSETTSC